MSDTAPGEVEAWWLGYRGGPAGITKFARAALAQTEVQE